MAVSLSPTVHEFVKATPNASMTVQRSVEACRAVHSVLEDLGETPTQKALRQAIAVLKEHMEVWEAGVRPWEPVNIEEFAVEEDDEEPTPSNHG